MIASKIINENKVKYIKLTTLIESLINFFLNEFLLKIFEIIPLNSIQATIEKIK